MQVWETVEKGSTPLIGYNEYQELKILITNLNDKEPKVIDELKDKTHRCSAVQSVVNNVYQNNNIVAIFEKVF